MLWTMPSRPLCLVLVFFFSGMFSSTKAWAISEQNYQVEYDTKVLPFFTSQGEEGTIKTPDEVEIAYKVFQHPESVADLVIMQGWTESYAAYPEFIYDMYQNKVSTYLFDWRGQGRSQRFLPDRQKSFVRDYLEYTEDLRAFMEQIVKPRARSKPIALAFSMGANILSIYETRFPQSFARMILISPMLDIKSDPFPQWFAWSICRVAELLGQGDQYVFGHGPFDGKTLNQVTSSDIRFQQWVKYRDQNRDTVISGATFSWLRASLEATWFMREQAPKLEVPILMFQAGQDQFVRTHGQDIVCAEAQTCLKLVIPAAKHAILAESDRIRNKAMAEVLEFIRDGY